MRSSTGITVRVDAFSYEELRVIRDEMHAIVNREKEIIPGAIMVIGEPSFSAVIHTLCLLWSQQPAVQEWRAKHASR